MRIMLDEEQWEVADHLSLLEILAQVNDKAQAKQSVVTSLEVGGKKLTDRDLQPILLSRLGREVGTVHATSRTMKEILAGADEPLRRFGALLKRQGTTLVNRLRAGAGGVASIDGWLGLLADYVEGAEAAQGAISRHPSIQPLSPWVGPLLEARSSGDVVRLADLLEYELLPRLSDED